MAEWFIDTLGDFCPIPYLKAQAALKQVNPGDCIVLITDHSCAVTTLKEDLSRRRIAMKVEELDYGIWKITVYKPANKFVR